MSEQRNPGPEPVLAAFHALRPATALAVGEEAAAPLTGIPGCRLVHRSTPPWMAEGDAESRFDLVYVDGALEQMSKAEGLRLLCRLRDFHTPRLYVRCVLGDWTENDFFGLGMERLAVTEKEGRTVAVFRFDLFTYKPAPEWFNAKYWAHPELWDKYPWLES